MIFAPSVSFSSVLQNRYLADRISELGIVWRYLNRGKIAEATEIKRLLEIKTLINLSESNPVAIKKKQCRSKSLIDTALSAER